MTEVVGGVMMLVGGGLQLASMLVGGPRAAIERARELLGDSSPAVVRQVPADMSELLDRLN